MKKAYEERIKTLKDINVRNEYREIEGCASWRHFAVHQDRAWLLNAINKTRTQVEKIRQAESSQGARSDIDAEVHKLLSMFEDEALNHIGDD